MQFQFIKDQPDANKRKSECAKIRSQFPDKIPIICEKDPKSKSNIAQIDKTKYLVPMDLTVSQFELMIRKRIQLGETQALYLIVGKGTQIQGETMISEVYAKHHSPEDDFLYITYAGEQTWG